MSFAHKIRVGVLRGGPSPEYEVSLDTGRTILSNLPDEYEPLDIFISKDGAWHTNGLEKSPDQILKSIDIAFNAMHGEFGEDGTVQKIFESFGTPYIGSKSLASAFGMNKIMTKSILNKHGIKTPQHIIIEKNEDDGVTLKMIDKISESLPFPIIIKPANLGSSLGVSFVDRKIDIKKALQNSFIHSPKLMIEEFIDGKEATCGVIEGFRGQKFYTLLPVEVLRLQRGVHDYNSKYNPLAPGSGPRYRVPGNFRHDEKIQIEEAATKIHQALGLRHYSRSDFIIHPKRGLFTLEVNTLPELTHRSSFVKSLEAAGGDIREFLSHLLSKTLNK